MTLSPSFLQLKPKECFIAKYKSKEFEEYVLEKNKMFPNVPRDAFEELFFPHWDKLHLQELIGHLDFHSIQFSLLELDSSSCMKILWHSSTNWVEKCETWNLPVLKDRYRFLPSVIESWEKDQTWAEPIWIMDSKLSTYPTKSKYLLLEGHSRLGFFLSQQKINKVAQTHSVWILENA